MRWDNKMKGLYLIPDKGNIELSVQLLEENNGAFEYNDFFLAHVLDDKKKQLELIEYYAKWRTNAKFSQSRTTTFCRI